MRKVRIVCTGQSNDIWVSTVYVVDRAVQLFKGMYHISSSVRVITTLRKKKFSQAETSFFYF